MERLRASNSIPQLKVSTSMDFILKVLDGTRLTEDLKILNQRSFTTHSLFFTSLLYPLLLVTLTNLVAVVVTSPKQNLPT
jgi:hypothetical protein